MSFPERHWQKKKLIVIVAYNLIIDRQDIDTMEYGFSHCFINKVYNHHRRLEGEGVWGTKSWKGREYGDWEEVKRWFLAKLGAWEESEDYQKWIDELNEGRVPEPHPLLR